MLMTKFLLTTSLIFNSILCIAQKKVLSGTVRDANTGETLIGAVITEDLAQVSTSTNSYGFYSLLLPQGDRTVSVSYVGYETQTKVLSLNESIKYDVELIPNQNKLEEVIVSGTRRSKNVKSPQMGAFKFSTEEIKNVPVLFGEKDLLKTIQLLPGVQSGGEGSANFFCAAGVETKT